MPTCAEAARALSCTRCSTVFKENNTWCSASSEAQQLSFPLICEVSAINFAHKVAMVVSSSVAATMLRARCVGSGMGAGGGGEHGMVAEARLASAVS
jgi:hypothetical protein